MWSALSAYRNAWFLDVNLSSRLQHEFGFRCLGFGPGAATFQEKLPAGHLVHGVDLNRTNLEVSDDWDILNR
eukprot:3601987-Rhodomonas_salina.1